MHSDIIHEALTKQPRLSKHFMTIVKNNHLSHAYLLYGEDGSGKLALAKLVALRLFCQNPKDNYPCGKCTNCHQVQADDYPDVVTVKPEGRSIRIHQVRQLRADFSRKASESNYKVFIIDHADTLTDGAVNSLLKSIEEPQGHTVIFLITNDKNQILPTVVSRTQPIKVPNVPKNIISRQLQDLNIPQNQLNLLVAVTTNLKKIIHVCQNNHFGQIQSAVEHWFIAVSHNDWNAFNDVKVDLMSCIKSRSDESLMLNVMIQLFDELLNLKYQQIQDSQLKFPNIQSYEMNVANTISNTYLIKSLKLLINDTILLKRNLNFQNILEYTTIRLLNKKG